VNPFESLKLIICSLKQIKCNIYLFIYKVLKTVRCRNDRFPSIKMIAYQDFRPKDALWQIINLPVWQGSERYSLKKIMLRKQALAF